MPILQIGRSFSTYKKFRLARVGSCSITIIIKICSIKNNYLCDNVMLLHLSFNWKTKSMVQKFLGICFADIQCLGKTKKGVILNQGDLSKFFTETILDDKS